MVFCASDKPPLLFAILGPTACGKTALALDLAQKFDLDIVNCDSRQIYQEMPIGTAGPTDAELAAAPHHLFACIKPDQLFSAGDYARAAQACVEKLWQQGKTPLIVGGTGFYFEALTQGLPEAEVDPALRQRLQQQLEERGLPDLTDELRRLDPQAAATIDLQNSRRVTRALEIIHQTGAPLEKARRRQPGIQADLETFFVSLPREKLHERIIARVDQMMERGLEEEVRRLFDRYGQGAPGLKAIGYNEWTTFFSNSATRQEVLETIVIHTRQYAKRQETWFRNRLKCRPSLLDLPETSSKIDRAFAAHQPTP